jgi:hypothetical protein
MQRTQWQEQFSPLIQTLISTQPSTQVEDPLSPPMKNDLKDNEKSKVNTSGASKMQDHLPQWLSDIYTNVWLYKLKHNDKNMLTMKELMIRPIDAESPVWFLLPRKKNSDMSDRDYRIACWTAIRRELYKALQRNTNEQQKNKTGNGSTMKRNRNKQSLYAYHNAAVLCFHLNDYDLAFQLMDMLIDSVFHAAFLKTVSYFYIQTGQLLNAAVVLYHLLNRKIESDGKEDGVDFHALYLTMRLLTQHMKDTKYTKELVDFRHAIMKCICYNKANNHLYKLWLDHWKQEASDNGIEIEEDSIMDLEDAKEDTLQLLKQILGTDHESEEDNESNNIAYRSSVSKQKQKSFIGKCLDYLRSIFTDYQSILRIIGTILSIIGIGLFVKGVKRIFNAGNRNNNHSNQMFQSMLHSFYNTVEDDNNRNNMNKESQALSIKSPDVNLNVPRLVSKEDDTLHSIQFHDLDEDELKGSDNIQVILRPTHVETRDSHSDKSADEIENDRVVFADYEYVDNLYREISDFTRKSLSTKEETPVAKKTGRTTDNKIQVTTSESPGTVTSVVGTEGIPPQKFEAKTSTTKPLTKKSKKTTTTTRTPISKNVKVFGKRNI